MLIVKKCTIGLRGHCRIVGVLQVHSKSVCVSKCSYSLLKNFPNAGNTYCLFLRLRLIVLFYKILCPPNVKNVKPLCCLTNVLLSLHYVCVLFLILNNVYLISFLYFILFKSKIFVQPEIWKDNLNFILWNNYVFQCKLRCCLEHSQYQSSCWVGFNNSVWVKIKKRYFSVSIYFENFQNSFLFSPPEVSNAHL